MPRITLENSPGLLPPFCTLQAIKNWSQGRRPSPRNEANTVCDPLIGQNLVHVITCTGDTPHWQPMGARLLVFT